MNEDRGDFVIVHTPTPEQVNDFMDNLVFDDAAIDPKDIPPPLAPGEEIMVPITLRVTTSDFLRIKELAAKRGEKYTVMVRNWVEAELASAEAGAPVGRDEALRAVEVLRKLGMVA